MGNNVRVLFILKKRIKPIFGTTDCHNDYSYTSSPGLKYSAKLVSDMLNKYGIVSKIVDVQDNNCIDKEVFDFKPTHVIIEALWVVPEKFVVLGTLYPDVTWIVRVHSKLPFIANEGIAIEWIYRYGNYGVFVAFNTPEMLDIFEDILGHEWCAYLPNYYPTESRKSVWVYPKKTINIGCFGAIRPLKNQLTQAIASIKYAEKTNKQLFFHINSTRIENNGEAVLKNIINLFYNMDPDQFHLIEHPWYDRNQFLEVLSDMDILLQVSFSETFNMVAADAVSQGVPIVVSKEIKWAHPLFYAEPTNINSITAKIEFALFMRRFGSFLDLNWAGLKSYSKDSVKQWMHVLCQG